MRGSRRVVSWGVSYAATCRCSNPNIGSNPLAPTSWTLAAREAPPSGAPAVQERPQARLLAETVQGRVALVTGGATGLGRAICLEFAQHGTAVAFNYLRSEEHTSELQSLAYLVCRLLLEKKKN